MGVKNVVYNRLLKRFKPIARVTYQQFLQEESESSTGKDFVDVFFEEEAEYEKLCSEASELDIWKHIEDAIEEYEKLTPKGAFGEVDSQFATDLYAYVRKAKPSTIVETGVCNGVSTLFILKALSKNGSGHLYSVDYPYHAEEDLQEFRNDTFEDYGGAAIPHDKTPGWIIPDNLNDIWTLKIGKSQKKLPSLLENLDRLDLFIHDSEHSHPCMMFEFEIAWHKIGDRGTILSDDINWNGAFDVFCDVRKPVWGTLGQGAGFMTKS